jgi:hypothetical protein
LTAQHVAELENPYQEIQVSIGSRDFNPVPLTAPADCDKVLDLCFLKVREATVLALAIPDQDYYQLRCRPVVSQEPLLAYGTVIAIVKGGEGLQTAIQPIQLAHRDLMVRGYDCVPSGQAGKPIDTPIEISGRWHDGRDSEIEILRDGDRFGLNGTVDGVLRMGFGTIRGSDIEIAFDGSDAVSAMAVPYNRTFSSGACTNQSDRGCTVDQRVCLSSPAGFHFANVSVVPGASEGDGRKDCTLDSSSPDAICAVAHAESGSGVLRLGKTAFQECSVEASLLPVGGSTGRLHCNGKATTDSILLSCIDRDGVGTDWILQR